MNEIICTKAKKSIGLNKESQDRTFQNTALCRHAGSEEYYLSPMGMRYVFIGLGFKLLGLGLAASWLCIYVTLSNYYRRLLDR